MLYDLFEDTQIGNKVVSPGRTITETDVVMFMMFTGNWEALHADAEYSKKSKFGQRLVQGTLVFALGPGLLPLKHDIVVANYGIDKVRFIKPVFIGDTIHVEREILSKEDKGEMGGVVTFQMTFKNQREEVVQVAVQKLMVGHKH
jgi:3-hydroxybutyryl-CoA dehydratase